MPVRRATVTDASAVRAIWNATRTSINRPGMPMPTLTVAQTQALVTRTATVARVWHDATATVHGVMLTAPTPIKLNMADRLDPVEAEEASVLFPRPSISTVLFKQVVRELLLDWCGDCRRRKVPWCWGRFPTPGPLLMDAAFAQMQAINGAVPDDTREPGFRYWIITPQQGLGGAAGIV